MKKLHFNIIRLIILSALLVIGASGNTVSLDTTFNGTGYMIQQVAGAESSYGNSIAVMPNGKILVSGATRVNSDTNKPAVMRLNTDGTLDTSFNGGGFAFAPIAGSGGEMLLQPDGKILLSATVGGDVQTFSNFAVFRLTSDGAVDTTFNSNGYTIINIDDASLDHCYGMGLQADGKIVLVGEVWQFSNQQYDMAVVRLNANGSLDTTFNGSGILRLGTQNADETAQAALIQADGKILVGGFEKTNVDKFLLTRLNANGTTDTSFGTDGKTVSYVGRSDRIVTMALQSDGKIIAGGFGGSLARYTTSGALDTSFGANGVSNTAAEIGEIRVIGGDKVLISAKFGGNSGALRYMPNGAPDTNFHISYHPPGNNCVGTSVAMQSDGKVVLGGYCTAFTANDSKFTVFRYQENRTKRFLDFDGNESTEISVYRPSNGQWWILYGSTQTVAATFGLSTDRPVPADYTGDGRADVAVFRPSSGEWFFLRSENGTFYSFPFGTAGDVPVPGDYDGDQIDDAGVFRPSTGEWFIQKSTGGVIITRFGLSDDKPVPSDYDGDFKTDIAIYRPSSGEWWINKSSDSSVYAFQFGTATDKPVQGDYTGDNKTDAAFWRPSTGEWFILRSEDNSYYSIPFGLSNDLPAPGNYAGDAKFDLVVYRPSTNTWHIQPTGGAYFYRIFGAAGDQPVSNFFVP